MLEKIHREIFKCPTDTSKSQPKIRGIPLSLDFERVESGADIHVYRSSRHVSPYFGLLFLQGHCANKKCF